MKNKVLVFAIAFIALFAVNTAQAQNPHFEDVQVSEDGLTITGKIAGLGNKYTGQNFKIEYGSDISVTRTCTNPTGKVLDKRTEVYSLSNATSETVKGKNGHIKFTIQLNADNTPNAVETCKGDAEPEQAKGITTELTYSGTGLKTLKFTVGTLTKEMTL